MTEEEKNDVRNKVGIILDVIAIDKGRGAEDIISEMGVDAKFLDQITEIGKAEDITFYILDESSSMSGFEERAGKEYAQEYTSLHDSLIEVLKKAEFSVPVPSGSEYIGKKISFETTDVEGRQGTVLCLPHVFPQKRRQRTVPCLSVSIGFGIDF